MPAALAPTRALLALSILAQLGVFAAFALFERPGLGIGHGYYLAIGLAAVASGPLVGALAGVLSTALFVVGVYVNDAIPTAEALSVSTTIRGVMYVAAGALEEGERREDAELGQNGQREEGACWRECRRHAPILTANRGVRVPRTRDSRIRRAARAAARSARAAPRSRRGRRAARPGRAAGALSLIHI